MWRMTSLRSRLLASFEGSRRCGLSSAGTAMPRTFGRERRLARRPATPTAAPPTRAPTALRAKVAPRDPFDEEPRDPLDADPLFEDAAAVPEPRRAAAVPELRRDGALRAFVAFVALVVFAFVAFVVFVALVGCVALVGLVVLVALVAL